ncbi:antibiotic biosynthesis monooxygenase family protein [Dehalogenimonas alkenigignens]|uniref:Antibiotic biosynthesis monooxygenase n=1 Tax=Dehalogenimonas alkenigignens TaxID=1217799 RepID=A0A0W0GK28_9CHLR|nr:antibiotic biosynthesis monooxygenase [Dehalogenimonas alkenigignens]KTB48917.1 Antibiotic biosynthesis monooxygenase [Dehalogenimonas alkenigignens]PVV82757.1 hypothetical protein DD509_08180 [Dehalogenimonas alkenigignens]
MIKVMIGFHKKPDSDIQPVLQKLRSFAMTFQGFKGMESLESDEGGSIIVMEFNWESLDHWKAWKASQVQKQILEDAAGLLLDRPKMSVYKVVPLSGWPTGGSLP